MDAGEFEFPPDLLDEEVAVRLPTSPPTTATAAPSYVYAAQSLPLSVLAQTPVDQLPPTRPNNPQNFSIGQVMRGALSTAHMRPMSGLANSSGPTRAIASVAPLPDASAYTRPTAAPTHSPHLAAVVPPSQHQQRVTDGALPERGSEDSFSQSEGHNESGRNGGSSNNSVNALEAMTPLPAPSGRQARIDWSEGEVRSFYQALSQYGTDFSAIAVLFPRRSRSDIKRLYQREMRQKPKEVQQALNQKNPIDMKIFHERYEAKKKEEQVPVATKELNVEELALMDEIESGMRGGTSSVTTAHGDGGEGELLPLPAALEAGEEEATAAPTSAKSRKRKRESPVASPKDVTAEETLYDMAMRRDREDNTPLDSLFAEKPVALDDSDFTFE